MKNLIASLFLALGVFSPVTVNAEHIFSPGDELPAKIDFTVLGGFFCSDKEDLIYELENISKPISTESCQKFPYSVTLKVTPEGWVTVETDEFGRLHILLASWVSRNGTTYWTPMDHKEDKSEEI